ncbi:MAG: S26 family signal peptidase [Actinobacteria bacterium]|nr:S26 family signal peptidase [Actinomycetota bacterium]
MYRNESCRSTQFASTEGTTSARLPPVSKFGTVKVSGNSMLPAYRDGDSLVVSWIGGAGALSAVGKSIIGKAVVIEREERPGIFLVKRVKNFQDGNYWVEGDGPGSTDSRTWGWVKPDEIIGVVLFRYKKAKALLNE